MVRGFSFQKLPKCDWHGPRSHINDALPIKTADPVPAEVVQIGIEDDGNPRPLFVVAKNLTVANYSDNLAGVRIDNIAVEHVFLFCVSDVTFTTPNSPRCSGSALLSADARWRAHAVRCPLSDALDRLRAVRPARTYNVAGLMEQHGDAKLTELIVTLTNCPKAWSASVYDRCKAVFELLVVR